jgi:D-serine deaminase-like pyridoxal phosphate-dependent protein
MTAQPTRPRARVPVTVIDEDALKRAIQKAKEIADANPEKYRQVHPTLQ